jgi:DNA invertase Pin-like site-specific DNA recombinase
MGWAPEDIVVIDEDLGKSGASAAWRPGFRRLVEAVGAGRVGAIFALEVSRFARSSVVWHRLIQLCGWFDTLIVDENVVYDPSEPHDRLILGIQGQMSEAERFWMRMRLQGGKLNKARRGELKVPVPVGYRWSEASHRLVLDPDESVQAAVRLVFARFRLDGSAHAVMRYFSKEGLRLPSLTSSAAGIRWALPTRTRVQSILQNPVYSGTYTYGRRKWEPVIENGSLVRKRPRTLPREEWPICLPDWHPGYITWEEHVAIQDKLQANRWNFDTPRLRGAAREGEALLQGIVICGRCGHRMHAAYDRLGRVRYLCLSPQRHGQKQNTCWVVAGTSIDEAVERLFLEALQPPELELALAVSREAERQAEELDEQWRLRLDRARYEVRLAERRYKAVDPDNRVVARTLEREWEASLQALQEVEEARQAARREHKVELGAEDRASILALARDLPRVWHASSTTRAQQKHLVRILVREVSLTPAQDDWSVKVAVLWATGAVDELSVPHIGPRPPLPAAVVARLRHLFEQGHTDREIVDIFTDERVVVGRERAWTAARVFALRHRVGLRRAPGDTSSRRTPARREDGAWSAHGLAKRLGLRPAKVCQLAREGVIRSVEGGEDRAAWWLLAEERDFDRILRQVQGARTHSRKTPLRREDGLYSTRGVAELLQVRPWVVTWWVARGWLVPAERGGKGTASWFDLTDARHPASEKGCPETHPAEATRSSRTHRSAGVVVWTDVLQPGAHVHEDFGDRAVLVPARGHGHLVAGGQQVQHHDALAGLDLDAGLVHLVVPHVPSRGAVVGPCESGRASPGAPARPRPPSCHGPHPVASLKSCARSGAADRAVDVASAALAGA